MAVVVAPPCQKTLTVYANKLTQPAEASRIVQSNPCAVIRFDPDQKNEIFFGQGQLFSASFASRRNYRCMEDGLPARGAATLRRLFFQNINLTNRTS